MSDARRVADALTRDAFAAFGEVIETGSDPALINAGTSQRHHDLARIETGDGRPGLSVFRAVAQEVPLRVEMLERHPLGSQAFVPLDRGRMLIVVAAPGPPPDASAIRVFVSDGRQCINLKPGTWHHPLVALDRDGEFLVVDRIGAGENCDVVHLARPILVDIIE